MAASGPSSTGPAQQTTPPADPTTIEVLGYEAPTDPTWRWEPPKNTMRLVNWIIPAPEGAEPAELAVMHFPEASGNTTDRNIERWTSQFRGADLPVKPVIRSITVATMPTTLVELRGEYLGMGGGWHKQDYAMLVAMVESERGSIFIKLLGPAQTVDAARASWTAMVEGLRPVK